MKLSDLVASSGDSTEIKGIKFDSRHVQAGDAFFAIRGHVADGHIYLADVIKKNPAVLVVEDKSKVPAEYKGKVIVVKNTRAELDAWAAKFYGNPAEKLFCAAVTGTNGKTTSVYMIESIFNRAGRPTGVIGTIDHHIGKKKWQTSNTTPDAITLQSRLRDFIQNGAKTAAFEVTSIAIDQDRASSVQYDGAIFTNFTRDHLDYHKTMEQYFEAKEKLFVKLLEESTKQDVFAVLNVDDEWIAKLKLGKRVRKVTFGIDAKKSDYPIAITKQNLKGTEFKIGDATVWLATPGRHNVYNAAGVFVLAAETGIPNSTIADAFSTFTGAPGRLQSIPNRKGLTVFVDYAHTDDGLRSVLTSIRNLMRESNSTGKLWTVFGCGGDRDKGKRPLMTKAALESSDAIVLTADNPRTEDPNAIIKDGLEGIQTDKIVSEPDRKKAIAYALQRSREGDVILIAGKGHEDYQIVGQTKYPFSDAAVVEELLS